MEKALIVSVGGTPDPVAEAIKHHRPDFVCFLVSGESVETVPAIRAMTGLSAPDEKVLIHSAQDLAECYQKASECVQIVEERGCTGQGVVVDVTGGTKAMSAALAMAAAGRGYCFSYVGGEQRDSETGRVVSGAERVSICVDPPTLFGSGEKRAVADLFNRSQYQAALQLAEAVAGDKGTRLGPTRRLFKDLLPVLRGYLEWDLFSHERALASLRAGLERIEAWDDLKLLASQVEAGIAFLLGLKADSQGFHAGAYTRKHLLDLVANAKRRASEGKYDDAVARLYRSLEVNAQEVLLSREQIRTDAVPLARIPEEYRGEFRSLSPGKRAGTVRVPLRKAYRLLEVLGHAEGTRYSEREEEMRVVGGFRNDSILAHGLLPVGLPSYARYLTSVLALTGIQEDDLPVFPILDLAV